LINIKTLLLKLDLFGFKKTDEILKTVNIIYPFYQLAMHDKSVFVCTYSEFVMKITNMTKQIISNNDIDRVINALKDKFALCGIRVSQTIDNNIYFLREKAK